MAAQSRGSVKGLGLAAERLVAGDDDRGVFFAFGEDLEQQLGAALAEVHVAEVVNLCGHPHSSTYADTVTMPRCVRPGGRWPDVAGFLGRPLPICVGIVPG